MAGTEAKGRRRSKRRRAILIGILVFIIAPFWPAWWAFVTDFDTRKPQVGMNDASRLSATEVVRNVVLPEGVTLEALTDILREELQRAREQNLSVSLGGARHSMGAQTLARGGLFIDMRNANWMHLDAERNLVRAGAGAQWDAVIPFLNPHGRSVEVMQSNSSFTIGGSISVNCHGWQFGRPPIASTVESFLLMKADGDVLRCSRSENPELFSLALGGYGLFGILLEVELRVVDNELYQIDQYVVPTLEALSVFEEHVTEPDVAMAYGRMNVAPDRFLDELIITVRRRVPDAEEATSAALKPPGMRKVRRSLFRGSVGSGYGKRLRWWAETRLEPTVRSKTAWRNSLMSEPATVFENRKGGSTDILHEYFIPEDQVSPFVAALQEIIPHHEGNLLNVTVRHVDTDQDTFLRYADQPMFCFVMLFHQVISEAAERRMQDMTRAMIDAALDADGRYYLCYRLHASPEQFHRAYPRAKTFFERKRHYDPELIFQNTFYRTYARESD